ncbi:hypothetical protein [Enterococcus sp. BWR-S5]|nr:hypothetical protein [Enterococcus sp. BWR-S5]
MKNERVLEKNEKQFLVRWLSKEWGCESRSKMAACFLFMAII